MSSADNATEYLGSFGSLALFSSNGKAVVVDVDCNLVVESGDSDTLYNSRTWFSSDDSEISKASSEIAEASLQDLNLKVVTAAASRMYTIPKGAQAEAKKALEWHKEHHRGGTPVGMNTARILAEGGQIGIEKVRHIAKYFPRHEVDKKGKGWAPGEDNFPSNGRIAWALWGGDVAWRWAAAIVDRENKNARTATGYFTESEIAPEVDLEAFKQALYMDSASAPEFLARVRMDGSGIDRIYKIDMDGNVYVWDDGSWDNLGSMDSDIWTLDKALDDVYDEVEKSHIPIDPDSAIIICAKMQHDPYRRVSIEDIDAEEAALAMFAASEIDWDFIDNTLTAAAINPDDGVYSPDERSQNASKQVRNALGRFAQSGQRVVIDNDGSQRGTITKTSADGTVTVQKDSGEVVQVGAKQTREEKDYKDLPFSDFGHPLDVSGILGEPRTPINQPYAQLPGTLPSMTSRDLHDVLYNWSGWVQSQRDAFYNENPAALQSSGEVKPEEEEDDGHDHPLIAEWKRNLNAPKQNDDEAHWASPVVAATDPKAKRPYQMTPETSDVKPLYMAIVAEDDPRAVLDLVSIVPASSVSPAPMTYKRTAGKWVRDEGILNDLKSATPPPVVPLDTKVLNDVLTQVDEATVTAAGIYNMDHLMMVLWGPKQEIVNTFSNDFFNNIEETASFYESFKSVAPMLAAGGLDRNRGNAEELRRYWTKGKGALKVRWGTGGDWTRCVRHLSKYLGPRAKGYCALRHKEVTGMWTGDKNHRKLYGRRHNGKNVFSTEVVNSTSVIMDRLDLAARAQVAKDRISLVASGSDSVGASFHIPLVIPEGIESGDGRKFKPGAITVRELPLPLLWQIKTADGHNGSVVVGRIDRLERTGQGIGNAYGVFDNGPYGREAERLVRNGFIRGVSADMDQFEATENKVDTTGSDDDKEIGKSKITINKARIMAATIVPKPAFQECKILLTEDSKNTPHQEDNMIPDGVYVDDADGADAQALVACGIIAGAIPVVPPTEWFEDPKLNAPTPLTVDDMGRVFGHIAAWHVDHIGMAYGTKPPRSKTGYAYFHTGVVRTDSGKDVPVGQLTLAGGHASLEASAMEAVKHYDDTASAIADVHAGEDKYGIWVAGSLRPNATPDQIRALRASAPSGDWRPIRGALELVAVCQVNVPGFPIARARVASGAVMALVAAGASTLAKMKSDPVAELMNRVTQLEKQATPKEELATIAASLKYKVDAAKAEFGYISRDERKALAEKGEALPDGSYPIRNVEDLKNAIKSYGRSNPEDRSKVRKHIEKRARQLNFRHLIPEEWKTAASAAVTASAEDLKARLASAQEALGKVFAVDTPVEEVPVEETPAVSDVKAEIADRAKYIPGVNQPRDIDGQFRQVLARLKNDIGDAELADVNNKIKEVEKISGLGDYADAAKAGDELLQLLDRLDEGSLNSVSLENVRQTAAELGKVITNLPLPFKNQAQKVRFSDLPPALKTLMGDMIKRVEKKIGKDDAKVATEDLKGFISGSDLYSQSDISSQMAKLLRLLT